MNAHTDLTDTMTAVLHELSDRPLVAIRATSASLRALARRGLATLDADAGFYRITDAGRAALGLADAEPEPLATVTPIRPAAAETPAVRDRERRRLSEKARRAKTAQPCACGCGELTGGGSYRPGHDSKHAGAVGRQVAAEADGSTDSGQVRARCAALLPGRPALVDKAVKTATGELARARMVAIRQEGRRRA